MTTTVQFTTPASVNQPFAHALKFPESPVCGIIIGRQEENSTIYVDHAVPVAHNSMLGCSLQVALAMSDQWTEQNKPDSSILGVYFFDIYDSVGRSTPHSIENATAKALLTAIMAQRNPKKTLLLIGDETHFTFRAVMLKEGEYCWSGKSESVVGGEREKDIVKDIVKSHRYMKVEDIEEFLVDPGCVGMVENWA